MKQLMVASGLGLSLGLSAQAGAATAAETSAAAPAAAAAKPLAQLQEEFLQWRFGLFIHFGMATFNDLQWATGYEDPGTFAPIKLDCGQCVAYIAARARGRG